MGTQEGNCWFATIPEIFKLQRPWRPCWMTGTIKLIRIILLMVIQHGGDDVSCKPRIPLYNLNIPNAVLDILKVCYSLIVYIRGMICNLIFNLLENQGLLLLELFQFVNEF